MTDKDLLEAAALAAGMRISSHIGMRHDYFADDNTGKEWNPLEDDGDALRLAVKLGIDIAKAQLDYWDKHSNDPYAATRRAIVHAAAEIGRLM